MDFSEKVRGLLKSRHMSQSELAEALGTNQQQVSRWLEGNTPPKASYLLLMARSLGVTADYLIDPAIEELPSRKDLPEDEATVLRVYRNLKQAGALDEASATHGLALAASDALRKRGAPGITSYEDLPEAGFATLPEERSTRRAKRSG